MPVPPWLSCMVTSCIKPFRPHAIVSSDDDDDELLWCKDIRRHSRGEFSFAACQANQEIEDHSQVEIGSNELFVGVYDGHGGDDCSRFIKARLFNNLINVARNQGTIDEETLREAFAMTEDGFMLLVQRGYELQNNLATVGSCCLVGVIWEGVLYISNLGDSRAIVGTLSTCRSITTQQLTTEHNCIREEIRQELRAKHPNDPDIVVLERGAWRVKGIIQVSRTIGDAYLKSPTYMKPPLTVPVLSAEPTLNTRVLTSDDKFLIFASDGLWEHLTNQQAAEIVHLNPRRGIARRLIKAAVQSAAKRANMEYRALRDLQGGSRRVYHDDITVVVVFLDGPSRFNVQQLSLKAFEDEAGVSEFQSLHDLM
ncbi:hypothetical protein LR48_Vigan03g222300 [Vigna angularis]|uniref:protein-serine/threonine phosphatase n=2 Tax=Phaseolus angularis TaxID=3914 RepID=A0A0L9U7X9_PHAAN|nr:probable protein phosphatase 2C 43 isoform X1 [Vigna angularis]XP_017417837.1 probable protein phosphatase 2C 43 isoform X1 [Vigna angularis]KAG2405711.1 protein phosphatase 2C 43 [Vigna angularis]KOM38841.1 hypothetical protein LR48_Vigan03g222300 [Vigna angularis]